jgi:hypothetical protein
MILMYSLMSIVSIVTYKYLLLLCVVLQNDVDLLLYVVVVVFIDFVII